MKTLGEVRKELLVRIGFSDSQGHENNKALIDGIIEHAQNQLFFHYDYLQTRKTGEKTISAGSVLYDAPIDCDYRRVIDVVIINSSGKYELLKQGIVYTDENNTVRSMPKKYDWRDGQFLVNPIPDKAYIVRFEYYKKPLPLTQDGDELSIDDELVFILALVDLKNHYRMDSQVEQQQFKAQLDKKQHATFGTERYFRA